MKTQTRQFVTSSPRHVVHLSYAVVKPKYTSPERWLSRVAFISGIPQSLLDFGQQTVIYNIDYKGELDQNGVRYIFPGFKRWQLVLPLAFNRFVRSLKPNVVLVHGLIFPWQIILLRNVVGRNVKIICQHHADRPFKDFRKYIFRWADKYVSAYLFAAKEYGEEWVKAKQISSMNKVHEIMGMSSSFHYERKRRSGKIYLWIGDLDSNKDPLLLVNAFNAFSQKHNDVTLYMIYQQSKLDLKDKVGRSIHLVGKVEHSELRYYFNTADYIISTSHYESAGIAVCEAMSCGCFPILTDIPSFRMMTGNGKIGRLFRPGDQAGLLSALEETTNDLDPDKIIDHFNAELSFEANARKIMNVLKQL
ncbi:MAG: glycosyltransferase family 4 protein [Bacteroidota bacterium]